jgi:hypothetical protein
MHCLCISLLLPNQRAQTPPNFRRRTFYYMRKSLGIKVCFFWRKKFRITPWTGILKLDAVDAVDAVDALHPHLLKLDAVHPVPTKTGCSIQYLLKLDAVHPVSIKNGYSGY